MNYNNKNELNQYIQDRVPDAILAVDPSIKGFIASLLQAAWKNGYYDGLKTGKKSVTK